SIVLRCVDFVVSSAVLLGVCYGCPSSTLFRSVGATQWRGPADARRPAGEGRRNRSRRAARGGLSASAPRRPSAAAVPPVPAGARSEEHTSELQSRFDLVCRLLL